MESQIITSDFRQKLAIVGRWGWLLVLGCLLSGVTAYILSKRSTPVYQAATVLLVNEAPTTKATDYSSLLTSERLARTYIELINTIPVMEEVIDTLQLSITPEELQRKIEADLIQDTQLIVVRVDDTNPEQAVRIANTLVEVFSRQNQEMQSARYSSSKASLEAQVAEMDEQIQRTAAELEQLPESGEGNADRDRLETALNQYRQMYAALLTSFEQVRVAESSSISTLVVVESAAVPERPIRPRTVMNTILAALIGLLFALGIAMLMDSLDDTLNPNDVTDDLGLPVLGVIAHHRASNGIPVAADSPRSPVSEAYRSLRTNIQFASVDRPIRSLVITSPSPEDGKSTVAVNLAIALAQGGRKTILVEADLRRPQVHKKLGLPNRTGLSTMFVQPLVELNGAEQATEIPNLSAITSGDLPPNPSELLSSNKMQDIIDQVQDRFDFLLIDTPPILAVTDAVALAARVDGIVLVVKPGITKLAACKLAIEQLRRLGANILGVVLNDIEVTRSRYKYGYYRGYYHTYHSHHQNERDTLHTNE